MLLTDKYQQRMGAVMQITSNTYTCTNMMYLPMVKSAVI